MFSRAEQLAGMVWLLEVVLSGMTYRFSSEPVELVSTSGPLWFGGGMDQISSFSESLPVVGEFDSPRSQSVTVSWTDDLLDLMERHHDLSTATGRLMLGSKGAAYERALLLVEGDISQGEYGEDGDPVSFTIRGDDYDDTSQLLPSDMVITANHWPTAAESAINRPYPLIIGNPGKGEVNHQGSPAYAVEATGSNADYLVIAAHPVEATEVTVEVWEQGALVDSDTANTDTAIINGRTVTILDVTSLSTTIRSAPAWSIRWHEGGGMLSPYTGEAITTVGEAARWLADQSTLPVHSAAWAILQVRFPWTFSTYIDEPASAMDILQEQVLPLIPVGIVGSSAGLMPVEWRYDATRSEAVTIIEEGVNASRVGGIEYVKAARDVLQDLRVGYCIDGSGDSRSWLNFGDPRNNDQETATVNSRANALYFPDRPGRTEVIEQTGITTAATAMRFACWKILAIGRSPRAVTYQRPIGERWLRIGDVVLVEDPDVRLSEELGIVIERSLTTSEVSEVTIHMLSSLQTIPQRTGTGSYDVPPPWVLGN